MENAYSIKKMALEEKSAGLFCFGNKGNTNGIWEFEFLHEFLIDAGRELGLCKCLPVRFGMLF